MSLFCAEALYIGQCTIWVVPLAEWQTVPEYSINHQLRCNRQLKKNRTNCVHYLQLGIQYFQLDTFNLIGNWLYRSIAMTQKSPITN